MQFMGFVFLFAFLAMAALITVILSQMLRIERLSPSASLDILSKKLSKEKDEPAELIDLASYYKSPEREMKKAAFKNEDDHLDAQFDPLCELKTGRGFLIDCQKTLAQAKESNRMLALCYLDFDRFRFINSLKGVLLGDYALSHMARALQAVFPAEALCTRLSADHFIILFPLADNGLLADYTEQLRRACERIREDIGVKSGLRACVGVAFSGSSAHESDISILINKANIARHCMKMDKTASYCVFDDSMITTFLYGESSLEDYGENQYIDDIALYYQPQADLSKTRIVSADSLARWQCVDDLSKTTPITSENGRLASCNSKIVYHACRTISRWRKTAKEPVPLIADVSIIDFYKKDIDDFVGRCLAEFQLEPSLLLIGVDASILRTSWDMANCQLQKLRDLGVGIVVRGMDSGYSTLDFLDGLPVDFISLHKSFSHKMRENDERNSAVRNMLRMANEKNIQIMFEGVDSQTQADALRDAGARFLEGYQVGRPCLAEDFSRLQQEYIQNHRGSDAAKVLDEMPVFNGDFKLF